MQQIVVTRFQYGVGQGCFHGQEISYGSAAGDIPLVLRFVYDCGSTGRDKALKWPIDQFTNQDKVFPVHAVYVSHFEFDHVNGLALLCAKAQVERIYIPYIDRDTALTVIAKACADLIASGSGSSDKSALVGLAAILMEALGDGTIHGAPVIMVRPGDERPPGPPDTGTEPLRNIGDTAVARFPGDGAANRTITNGSTVRVEIDAGGKATDVWEIVHWCYAMEAALSTAIALALLGLPGAATSLLPGLLPKSTNRERDQALKWIKQNFKGIAKAYRSTISAHNKSRVSLGQAAIPDDHNVTSLCVYSGPTFVPDGCGSYANTRARTQYCPCFSGFPCFEDGAASWLATGDAMLSVPEIWTAFESHFGTQRLQKCQTVLMPHHGSGKGSNFNQALARTHVHCVISAGANNGYRHPGRGVMTAILSKEAHPVLVNENDPLGFIEHLQLIL